MATPLPMSSFTIQDASTKAAVTHGVRLVQDLAQDPSAAPRTPVGEVSVDSTVVRASPQRRRVRQLPPRDIPRGARAGRAGGLRDRPGRHRGTLE